MTTAQDDFVARFLFEELDLRGAVVRLSGVWARMQEGHAYPAPVAALLGELCAVSVVIAGQLKQPGRLTFQLQGHGPVSLLVVDCSAQLGLRGMARHTQAAAGGGTLAALLGDGKLALTLFPDAAREPWQSIVPLAGDSVAAVFEHYLVQSEQQPARLWLAASAQACAGLFLQKLPGADARDADGWNRVESLAATVRAGELLGLAPDALLARLFSEETVRLYPAQAVHYDCPEDWEKVARMLRSLGRAEVDTILAEHGAVVVKGDICNREYRLGADDVKRLFDAAAPESGSVH